MKHEKICFVDGVLSLILRASQMIGITPLRFVNFRSGYNISVWESYSLFSYIIFTFVSTTGFIASVMVTRKKVLALVFLIKMFSALVLTGFGSFYGKERMNTLIKTLNSLEMLKQMLGNTVSIYPRQKLFRDRKKIIFIVLYLITVMLTVLVGFYYTLLLSPNESFGDKLILFGLGLFYMESIWMALLEIQALSMICEIPLGMGLLNNKMGQILEQAKYGNLTTNLCKIQNNVGSLSSTYILMCEVTATINKMDGVIVLLMFASFLITVVATVHFFVRISDIFDLYTGTQIIWCIANICKILTLIELCHRIYKEVAKMRVSFIKLMYLVTDVGNEIGTELELFYKQLTLNRPSYAPLGFFTLERSLIATMFSVILTYLLYFLQVKL